MPFRSGFSIQTVIASKQASTTRHCTYQLPNMRANEVMTKGAIRVHTVAALLICHRQLTAAM